jgi:hypothetical protein
MKIEFRLKHLLFITVFFSSIVNAGTYMGLAASLMNINADTGSTSPVTADISLGYAMDAHKLELVVMSGIKDDNINQLVTDIPIAGSLLYRYSVKLKNTLRLDLILGYSQVDIEASYVGIPSFTESYRGASFGIGLEEALKSIPQLKFRLEYIQLYRGDQLKINAFNIGYRYEF